jgi:PAS domain S-box-containing protein
MTLDQLATSSGVDRGTISRIELGHVSPRIDTIGFLCEAMNTNLSQFFGFPEGAETGAGPAAEAAGNEPQAERELQDGIARFDLKLPQDPAGKTALDAYWPVPSGFWRGLLEVLERFEVLVKNGREMILVKDRNNHLLYSSPACEEILGLRPQDMVGQQTKDFVHPDDLPGYLEAYTTLLRNPGSSQILDYRVRSKDGNWCRVSAKHTNQLENRNLRAVVINALLVE